MIVPIIVGVGIALGIYFAFGQDGKKREKKTEKPADPVKTDAPVPPFKVEPIATVDPPKEPKVTPTPEDPPADDPEKVTK